MNSGAPMIGTVSWDRSLSAAALARRRAPTRAVAAVVRRMASEAVAMLSFLLVRGAEVIVSGKFSLKQARAASTHHQAMAEAAASDAIGVAEEKDDADAALIAVLRQVPGVEGRILRWRTHGHQIVPGARVAAGAVHLEVSRFEAAAG